MVHRLALSAVLCVAACGGKAAPPPPPVQNVAPAEPVTAPPPAPKRAVDVAIANQMCGCAAKA